MANDFIPYCTSNICFEFFLEKKEPNYAKYLKELYLMKPLTVVKYLKQIKMPINRLSQDERKEIVNIVKEKNLPLKKREKFLKEEIKNFKQKYSKEKHQGIQIDVINRDVEFCPKCNSILIWRKIPTDKIHI